VLQFVSCDAARDLLDLCGRQHGEWLLHRKAQQTTDQCRGWDVFGVDGT
jgi:hypothetical protein